MKLLRIDLVRGYDWEGIYVLGKLWEEGHGIDWYSLLKKNVVGISTERWVDEDWLHERGSLPERYSEVKFTE